MPAAAQSLQAPYQLPAIEGQETVELCATLAGWQAPAPTRFRNWLWPLVQVLERLCRPTPPKACLVLQAKLAAVAVYTVPQPPPIGLGESNAIRVQLPETRTPILPPETASTTPWAHAPLPAPESLPGWTCTCTACRAQLQMRLSDVERLRSAHKLSCAKN